MMPNLGLQKKKKSKKRKKHKITKNFADLPKSAFYFYAWNDIEEVMDMAI